jgi:DNA-directed RNA polymerase subunit RPC12/RpoP
MRYKCISCSTKNKPVHVTPYMKNDGFLHCPICGSIEIEGIKI